MPRRKRDNWDDEVAVLYLVIMALLIIGRIVWMLMDDLQF